MPKIVTTSSRRKRPGGKIPPILAVSALALVAVLALIKLRLGSGKTAESPDIHPHVTAEATSNTAPGTSDSAAAVQAPAPSDAQSPSDSQPGTPDAQPVSNKTHIVSFRVKSDNPADNYIRNEADQIIAFAMQATDATGGMPPLPVMHHPDGGNKMFLDSLTNEIVVLETDSPKVREQKLYMIGCREQIKEIIDNGGTFEEAILQYRNKVNENANIRLSAIRKYQELKAEDPEAAEEYVKAVNELLEKDGITPINTTPRRRGRQQSNEEATE